MEGRDAHVMKPLRNDCFQTHDTVGLSTASICHDGCLQGVEAILLSGEAMAPQVGRFRSRKCLLEY